MRELHILLVEDNEADIFLTNETLEDINIANKISVARDGKEAMDFLDKAAVFFTDKLPDIILLDINLPKKNGHEVLQYIKSKEGLTLIPVIMLSTSSAQRDIDLAYENGASGYLVKPLEAADFLKQIEELKPVLF